MVSVLGDLDMNEREYAGDNEGAISGGGTVTVVGQVRGIGIFRPESGDLVINAGSFDLDGDVGEFGHSEIDATSGSITFNGPHVDGFGSGGDDIIVGFGRLVTFSHAWTLEELGSVSITDGGLINNGTWQSDGEVTIDHTVPFGVVGIGGTGAMIQGPTGTITTSGIVDFLGHSTIGGSLHVTTEAVRFSAGGSFNSGSKVTLDSGTELYLIFDQTYHVEPGATFAGAGDVIVGELATLVLENSAAIGTSLTNRGRLQIGASPGNASVGANFEQASTGVAEFEIGGVSLRNFDQLEVTDDATLGGTLELSLINGFIPEPGDTFQIITADAITGTFDTLLGADLGNGLMFEIFYSATDVVLEVTGSLLAGDLNKDGFVGVDDLNLVLLNWNQTIPPGDPMADPTGDNFVGVDDLNIVLVNWSNGTPPNDAAAIPEPVGVAYLLTGLALGLTKRGRRHA